MKLQTIALFALAIGYLASGAHATSNKKPWLAREDRPMSFILSQWANLKNPQVLVNAEKSMLLLKGRFRGSNRPFEQHVSVTIGKPVLYTAEELKSFPFTEITDASVVKEIFDALLSIEKKFHLVNQQKKEITR